MSENLSNGYQSTLSGAINSSDLTLTVTSASGIPAAPFRAILKAGGANLNEIILVTAVSGTTLTFTRAVEPIADGTQVAQSHASGAIIAQVLTVAGLQSLGLATTTIGTKVYNSTTQSITNAGAALTFDSEEFDTDGFHDTGSNTSKITIPVGLSGKYLILGGTYGATNLVSWIGVKKNGNSVRGYQTFGTDAYRSLSIILDLVTGDYIEVFVTPSVTTTFGHASLLDAQSWFSAIKLDSGRVGSGVGAVVYNNTTQSVSDSTPTDLTFNSEDFDTDGFHSVLSNTNRLTVPAGLGGKYLVIGSSYSSDASVREIGIKKNGTTYVGGYISENQSSTGSLGRSTQVILDLQASDYVTLEVNQTSGSPSNYGHGSARQVQSTFSIMRLDSNASGVLASGRVALTTGDITTTSNTFVDATGLLVTLTTGARRCLVSFSGNIRNDGNDYVALDFTIDGTRYGATDYGVVLEGGANGNGYHHVAFSVLTNILSAGSHTFQMQIRRGSASTARLTASTAESAAHFAVQEMPDSGSLVASASQAGQLLTYTRYAPTATDTSTSSTSFVDIDGTNLAVTFTTPSSGRVLVRVTGHCYTATGSPYYWDLREGSTALNVGGTSNRNGDGTTTSMALVVTGLTPGSSHTYKWAHAVSAGTGHIRYGPGGLDHPPAVMEVWALP